MDSGMEMRTITTMRIRMMMIVITMRRRRRRMPTSAMMTMEPSGSLFENRSTLVLL